MMSREMRLGWETVALIASIFSFGVFLFPPLAILALVSVAIRFRIAFDDWKDYQECKTAIARKTFTSGVASIPQTLWGFIAIVWIAGHHSNRASWLISAATLIVLMLFLELCLNLAFALPKVFLTPNSRTALIWRRTSIGLIEVVPLFMLIAIGIYGFSVFEIHFPISSIAAVIVWTIIGRGVLYTLEYQLASLPSRKAFGE